MLELEEHKAYLWKYKLSYGETRTKKDDIEKQVFPFMNKIVETTFEDCCSKEVEDAIMACQSAMDLFHIVSDEWKDTYFLEVSNHLEPEEFSAMLKEVYDTVGLSERMTHKTYAFECERASEEVKQYLHAQGILDKAVYVK